MGQQGRGGTNVTAREGWDKQDNEGGMGRERNWTNGTREGQDNKGGMGWDKQDNEGGVGQMGQ